jgi:hypothetical protein
MIVLILINFLAVFSGAICFEKYTTKGNEDACLAIFYGCLSLVCMLIAFLNISSYAIDDYKVEMSQRAAKVEQATYDADKGELVLSKELEYIISGNGE